MGFFCVVLLILDVTTAFGDNIKIKILYVDMYIITIIIIIVIFLYISCLYCQHSICIYSSINGILAIA